MYSSPEALAVNPPESWRIVKRAERLWDLLIDASHEHPAETFRTRALALAERDNPQSRMRREVDRERRWYEGEPIPHWKSYAECMADRQRNEAYQAKRRAESTT